ncbi:hypothetical protein CQW23_16437 [Capsicum baccatum]|uniref:Retrovirus-related Pol polyprotein from transposon TNT 1-94-like beta-barrel domain-containing protein n=1 Tax=Capsicum baccatum TaxID=33114 RepID=A0A2G2WB36_CAPBA|nr:hypothetical protein CQW23_16437 [Capsicum baccatum]
MIESNKECDDLCAMFSECNLTGNPHEWWMDSSVTRHVCANKELFLSFALAQAEEMIYMANFATAKVEETGKNCLKMTSGKVLTLNNVLYVPELHRNLISISLLDKNGFKCVTVSGKIVISKDKAGEEAEWLPNFMEDISYWPKPVSPVCIHCDNQAAIARAGTIMYNSKSRHIRRRHNTIRELLSSGIITIDYVNQRIMCQIHLQKAYLEKKWKECHTPNPIGEDWHP